MTKRRSSIQMWLVGLLASFLVGCASVPIPKLDKSQTPSPKDIAAVRQDIDGSEHAAAVSWRMAVSGREYCGAFAENLLPFTFGAVPPLTPAGEKLAYWKTYHIEEGSLYITGVLDPDVSPTLKYDRVVAIGTTRLPEPLSGNVLELLRAEAARGSLSLTLARAGKVSIPLKKGCRGYFMLVRSDKPMATVSGNTIVMSTGLSRYANSDDELAFLIGRELALNNSKAVRNIKAAAYATAFVTGLLRAVIPLPLPFGSTGMMVASAVQSSYDGDADRGSFALMLKAGYDPRVIPAFWSRLDKGAKADRRAQSRSEERTKAWVKMIAAVPKSTFDQPVAARQRRKSKASVNAPTDMAIHAIAQSGAVADKHLPATK